jgi:hypothetical protein
MKKLLTLALILVMVFTMTLCVFAEEVAQGETDQTTQAIVEETTDKISTIVGIGGAAGIGAIVIAVIAFFVNNFKKFREIVNSLASGFKTIFSKDGKIENVPQAFSQIETEVKGLAKSFNSELDVVKEKLEKSESQNEMLIQVLSVFIINCSYINPYAKNELIQLITGTKEFGENVAETIKRIEASVEEAKANEVKPETPFLDKVTSEE